MKGDFTRNTFHPLKHFMRVLMQQGRVQLDADWNEQAAILLRYLRTLLADFEGPYGLPPYNGGFSITPTPDPGDFFIGGGHFYVAGILCEAGSTPVPVTLISGTTSQVQIPGWAADNQEFQAGQYVEVFDAAQPSGGQTIPAKISEVGSADPRKLTLTFGQAMASMPTYTAPHIRRIPTYLTQPDYPDPPKLVSDQQTPVTYQVYLDVWERLMTYVEDDSIREVALGGPDTAARTKLVWQVKTLKFPESTQTPTCLTVQYLNNEFQPDNRGYLKARVGPGSVSTDPCIIAPAAGYRGAENQLYRVEIHRGTGDPKTTDAATFKWSRENGCVVFPVILPIVTGNGTTTVTLENLGRDDRFGLQQYDWVEVEDDDSVLQNRPHKLLQVQSIDRPNMQVTLKGTPDLDQSVGTDTHIVGTDPAKHPLLRRWDHQAGEPEEGGLTLGNDGAALIVEGQWLNLEDGIQIRFQPLDDPNDPNQANQYRTGDYWLIPARTATGNIEWPRVKDSHGKVVLDTQNNPIPLALPPDGMVHYYAPLWVISVDSNGNVKADAQNDCRNPSAAHR